MQSLPPVPCLRNNSGLTAIATDSTPLLTEGKHAQPVTDNENIRSRTHSVGYSAAAHKVTAERTEENQDSAM